MTFEGEYQGGEAPEEHGHGGDPAHPHESPWVIVAPLAVLAVPAALLGFANVSGGVDHLLLGALPIETRERLHELDFSWGIALGSTAVALSGIAVAYLFYGARVLSSDQVRQALRPVHYLLERKYFLDDLYEGVIVQRVILGSVSGVLSWVDTYIVDGVPNAIAGGLRLSSSGLRLLQTGQVQVYGTLGFLGLVIAGALALWLTPL